MEINNDIIEWIIGKKYINMKKNKENNEIEYNTRSKYFKTTSRNQWTNTYGEQLVRFLLEETNHIVFDKKPRLKINNKILCPDIETDNCYYEVKTRNWTTTGTAGEKILGTPLKYCEIPKHTGKRVYIVLVGYQEYEAKNNFIIFNPEENSNKKNILDIFKNIGIEYIRCSDLLYAYIHKKNLEELKKSF